MKVLLPPDEHCQQQRASAAVHMQPQKQLWLSTEINLSPPFNLLSPKYMLEEIQKKLFRGIIKSPEVCVFRSVFSNEKIKYFCISLLLLFRENNSQNKYKNFTISNTLKTSVN